MAILTILEYPDKRLANIAEPVAKVDATIRKHVADMFETMYHAEGVGLAAIQVNIRQRIIVVDCSEERNSPLCIINPRIVFAEGQQYEPEGCLSLPGLYDKVERSCTVTVQGLNEHGEQIELNAEGLLAICLQHEIEHLDGKLFIDHLSKLKKDRFVRKLEKNRLQAV